MRRLRWPRCGRVKVERVPWARGKERATRALGWFLAGCRGRRPHGSSGVNRERVHLAVGMAVAWGRERGSLEGVSARPASSSGATVHRVASSSGTCSSKGAIGAQDPSQELPGVVGSRAAWTCPRGRRGRGEERGWGISRSTPSSGHGIAGPSCRSSTGTRSTCCSRPVAHDRRPGGGGGRRAPGAVGVPFALPPGLALHSQIGHFM